MKLLSRLFFLLMPVFAFCQNNPQLPSSRSGSDSMIIPSLNRAWTAPEFEDVFKIIIASQNNASEEIMTIEKNERLFAKLTDFNNYWFLDSGYHSLNDRFSFSLSIQNLVKTAFLNYYQKSKNIHGKMSFEKEIAALFDLLFGITKNQTLLAEEFMRATPNLSQVQLDGMKKMIQGAVSMESGALITIEKEYNLYSEASICRMAKAFSNFYSFMYPRIDAESKSEFDRRIANLTKDHPYSCVRTALLSGKN